MPILRERRAIEPVEKLDDERWTDFGDLLETGHFLLRVSGNGWSAQQLIDGDFLVMWNGSVIASLSVVAVVNRNETIVTQVIQGDDELWLLMSDSRSIAMQDTEILGILVGVIRRF